MLCVVCRVSCVHFETAKVRGPSFFASEVLGPSFVCPMAAMLDKPLRRYKVTVRRMCGIDSQMTGCPDCENPNTCASTCMP